MKYYLLFSLYLTAICLSAQDLTGKWVAYAEDNNGLYAELYLTQQGEMIYGYSYDEEEDESFCEYLFEGDFYRGRLEAENTTRINGSNTHGPTAYKLRYKARKNIEYLTGRVKPIGAERQSPNMGVFMGRGGVSMGVDIGSLMASNWQPIIYFRESDDISEMPEHVQKYFDMPDPATEPEPMPEPEPEEVVEEVVEPENPFGNAEQAVDTVATIPEEPIEEEPIEEEPIVLEEPEPEPVIDSIAIKEEQRQERIGKRELRVTKTIDKLTTTSTDAILHIYDSKEEDNDQITIFLNDEIIVEKLVVKNKYQQFNIKLQKGLNKLVFYADNLGDVPPNTANLRVIIEKKRSQYLMSTNEDENTGIDIFVE